MFRQEAKDVAFTISLICFWVIFFIYLTIVQGLFENPRAPTLILNDTIPFTTKGVTVYITPFQNGLLYGLGLTELLLGLLLFILILDRGYFKAPTS